jgi:MarR family transcriptional regulator, 2-MHQ and catechol-resistance regulon repressor
MLSYDDQRGGRQVERFGVEDNGMIRDEAVLETVRQLHALFPWVDAATTEANITFSKAHAAVFALLTPDLVEMGLSPSRFNSLRFLYVADDQRLTMSELRSRLGVSTPLVTKVIDSLVKDGWVVRVPGPNDRRTVYAQLTADGALRFEERLPVLHSRMIEHWVGLDHHEKRLLTHLLNKLRLGVLSRSTTLEMPFAEGLGDTDGGPAQRPA